MVPRQVSLNSRNRRARHVMSEGGWFHNVALEHADWIVDPGLLEYDDMICSGDW